MKIWTIKSMKSRPIDNILNLKFEDLNFTAEQIDIKLLVLNLQSSSISPERVSTFNAVKLPSSRPGCIQGLQLLQNRFQHSF